MVGSSDGDYGGSSGAVVAGLAGLSAAVLAEIVDAAPTGIFVKDADGVYVAVNRQAAAFAGVSASKVLGRTAPERFGEDVAVALMAHDRAVLDSGEAHQFEEVLPGPDGPRTFLTHKFPLHDDTGAVWGLCGISSDISERRRAELELAATHAQLELLVTASPVVIGVTTGSRLADATLEYVSPNLERIFGFHPGDAVGVPGWFPDRMHPEDRELAVATLLEALSAHRDDATARFRMQRADGDLRWVDCRAHVTQRGAPVRMLWYLSDVTDVVEADRQAREADEQRHRGEQMETLGRLAGGVAHDFNNMLSVVFANVDFVRGELAEIGESAAASAEAVRNYVAEIEQAGARAAQMIRRVLAFGRSDDVEVEVVRLDHLVTALDATLRRAAGDRVDIVVRVGPGLWPAHADPGGIERAIVNLVTNARDAMPDGGTITVSLDNINPAEPGPDLPVGLPAGRQVCLAVTDVGLGMSPEVLQRASEPFFTTKDRLAGTGLGLPTVFDAAAKVGGHVDIRTAPGQGTTVSVYLPAADPLMRPDVVPTASALRAGGGEVILVVDDEEAVRDAARGILRRHGYKVVAVHGPSTAIGLCENLDYRIDLLLTDVTMPGMDGIELEERVRALRPGLRTMLMSGDPGDVIPGESVRPRLLKPFTAEALLRAVGEVLTAGSGEPA